MKKRTLLIGLITVALASCLALVACGGSGSSAAPSDGFRFENQVGERIGSLYVNSPENPSWGDPIAQGIDDGSYVDVTLEATGAELYDVGIITNTAWNYDFYGVSIAPGDTLVLTSDGQLKGGSTTYTTEPYNSGQ